MTPDLEVLLAPSRWDSNRCTVDQAIAEIPGDDDRAKLAAACDDLRVPPGNIVRAFKALLADEAPGVQAVRRHQRRRAEGPTSHCRCP